MERRKFLGGSAAAFGLSTELAVADQKARRQPGRQVDLLRGPTGVTHVPIGVAVPGSVDIGDPFSVTVTLNEPIDDSATVYYAYCCDAQGVEIPTPGKIASGEMPRTIQADVGIGYFTFFVNTKPDGDATAIQIRVVNVLAGEGPTAYEVSGVVAFT